MWGELWGGPVAKSEWQTTTSADTAVPVETRRMPLGQSKTQVTRGHTRDSRDTALAMISYLGQRVTDSQCHRRSGVAAAEAAAEAAAFGLEFGLEFGIASSPLLAIGSALQSGHERSR